MQQAKSGLGSPTLPVKENSSSPVQQDGSAEQSPTSPSHSGSPLSSSMMPSQLVEESILQVQLVQQVKQPTSPLTPRDKKPTVSSSSHIVDKRSTVSPHQHTELGKKQVAFSVTLANMDNKFTTSPVLPSQLGKQVTPLTPTKEVKQSTAQSGKPASAHVTSPKPKVESATSACTPKASAYVDKQPVTKQASPSRIVKPETGLPKSSPVVISTKKADGAFASPVKQVNTNEIVASSTIPAKPGPILLQPASTVSSSAPEAAAGGVRTNTKGVSSATQPTTSKGKATGNMEPKKEGDNRIQTRVMKREKMAEGDVIKSDNFTWKIIKLIGSGGFGDVYKVVKADNEDKKEYALKTETCEGDKRVLRLKIEVCIMKLCCNVERPDRKKHFVEMIDRGKNDKFKFLVMTLVGQSLEDIRRNILRRNYSKPTAMQIAYQTLQSIYDLHELGYLHRDLKPQNFAIGLEPQRHIIYMLDFGIARKFTVGLTKELKAPRLRVKFIGTIRFASRACHNGIEQGRKDDLESWLYLAFDVLDNINGLPWKRLDRREVIRYKQKFFVFKLPKCYEIVPVEFKRLVKYVNSMEFADEPDYLYMTHSIRSIAKENSINIDGKLDWEMNPEELEEALKDMELSEDNRKTGTDDSLGTERNHKLSRKKHTYRKLSKGKLNTESKVLSSKIKVKREKSKASAVANR